MRPTREIPAGLPKNFMKRVRRRSDTGCWEWTLSLNNHGYGIVSVGDGKQRYAHRVAYVAANGPIPKGLELDHLCRNPKCVNPDHLEAVTHFENHQRGKRATATHCKHGHPFDEDNTYWRGSHRKCRACMRESDRRRRPMRNKWLKELPPGHIPKRMRWRWRPHTRNTWHPFTEGQTVTQGVGWVEIDGRRFDLLTHDVEVEWSTETADLSEVLR